MVNIWIDRIDYSSLGLFIIHFMVESKSITWSDEVFSICDIYDNTYTKRRAGERGLYGVKVSNKSDKVLSLSRL